MSNICTCMMTHPKKLHYDPGHKWVTPEAKLHQLLSGMNRHDTQVPVDKRTNTSTNVYKCIIVALITYFMAHESIPMQKKLTIYLCGIHNPIYVSMAHPWSTNSAGHLGPSARAVDGRVLANHVGWLKGQTVHCTPLSILTSTSFSFSGKDSGQPVFYCPERSHTDL